MSERNAQEVAVKFHTPDKWSIRHWDEYSKARKAYWLANKDGNQLHADFVGGLALIAAGYVKVEAPDDIKAMLVDDENMDASVIGAIVSSICNPLEAAVFFPLGKRTNS